jgi:hypothetical protein
MTLCVASDDSFVFGAEFWKRSPIDEHVVWREGQPGYCAVHCQYSRAADVQAVDLGNRGGTYGPGEGLVVDLSTDSLATCGGHQLGVSQSINKKLPRWKHHRGSYHWARQRPSSYFI